MIVVDAFVSAQRYFCVDLKQQYKCVIEAMVSFSVCAYGFFITLVFVLDWSIFILSFYFVYTKHFGIHWMLKSHTHEQIRQRRNVKRTHDLSLKQFYILQFIHNSDQIMLETLSTLFDGIGV